MLILNNEEVDQLLTITDTLEVLEAAFADLAEGQALWRPRSDMTVAGTENPRIYRLKSMDGIVPRYRTAAIRINSDVVTFPVVDGVRRQVKQPTARGRYYVGFIILFDTETSEPLAILPDGVVQRMRVGATSGLGAKYLARPEASTLGLIGSGWQAGSQVLAMCAVRPIREVRVFSPNREHREAFVRDMRGRLPEVDLVAVDDARAALHGADIVSLATNARDPLLFWRDVEPGMHVTAVHWQNLDVSLFRNADVVVSNARPVGSWEPGRNRYVYLHDYVMAPEGEQAVFRGEGTLDPASPDYIDWSSYASVGEMIAGRGPRRTSPGQVTLHPNNIGIALQFAAVGARVLERATAAGVGHHIPTEWLLETVHP